MSKLQEVAVNSRKGPRYGLEMIKEEADLTVDMLAS